MTAQRRIVMFNDECSHLSAGKLYPVVKSEECLSPSMMDDDRRRILLPADNSRLCAHVETYWMEMDL